jgi:type IV secretory pathway TraG/TraD family ATPase VirD4
MLVAAPTRGGKGLLAVSQLLTWKGSVIVNDIKGDLYTQTAGFRRNLGKVFVVDPTGTGNRYDPFAGKETEDELLTAATNLLFSSHDGDGKIFTQKGALMLTQIFLAARIEDYPLLLYARRLIREGLQLPLSSTPFPSPSRPAFLTPILTRRT